MSQINRHIAGMRAKAAGDHWESLVEAACRHYDEKAFGLIDKTPEPFHVTRSLGRGKFEGYYEKKAQVDYKGILQDGSCIAFEAKHTDHDRIEQSAVKLHQWSMLDSYQDYGAHCYVMVSIKLERYYRVPWNVWRDMKELFGHKFMNAADLQPYEVQWWKGIPLILEGVELKGGEDYDEA